MVDYERQLTDAEFSAYYPPEYYERFSEDHGYPHSWFVHPRRKWETRARTLLDLADLHGTEDVLEAGSAVGSLTTLVAPHARRVVGIDLSEYAVAEARMRSTNRGLGNVEFEQGSIDDLSHFTNESFDRVLAFDIVEHVYDPVLRGFLREAHRVLRSGGTLCIFTPNLDHYVERLKHHGLLIKQTPEHIAVRNWPMLAAQLKESAADFRVQRLFYNSAPYPIVRYLEHALHALPRFKKFVQWRLCVRLGKK